MPDGQTKLGGIKHDDGKPQLGLVAKSLIWAIGTVMTLGVDEYGRDNWRQGMDWDRPYNAALRHLTAWWDGEHLDPKSGKSHLWHAAAEVMFLIEYEAKGLGHDNRYQKSDLSDDDIPF